MRIFPFAVHLLAGTVGSARSRTHVMKITLSRMASRSSSSGGASVVFLLFFFSFLEVWLLLSLCFFPPSQLLYLYSSSRCPLMDRC
ncbi:hypothetical protein DFJ58DRAFT_343175 [Suillus subalutaceus]|uniref:uncharacterized protein n=1 Tax=Suillus subalutaceus TaxID=48586 RepID=UPI001B87D3B7|nr:uncharacterized protein DFJ58DRAFT_343175 [Suillus subalutaceus]KAG1827862.1 hypothetical protein DFJ58DRAFT_343175 [Suillus subalutaceus]